MNFLSLEYFLVVAEELNITKAAERLYISQQSLSNSIIKLEKTLGVQLFTRSPSFCLTFAGEKFLVAATEMLEIKTRALSQLDDIGSSRKGQLKIGISHTRGRNILPDLLPEFTRTHPQTEVVIIEDNSENLEHKLEQGTIDLVFGFLPILQGSVSTVELVRERLFLVVPHKFTMAIFGDKADFYRGKFSLSADILPYRDCPVLMLKEGNRVRRIMDLHYASLKVVPNIVLETDNIETAFALATEGMGITVYPEIFLKKLGRELKAVDVFPFDNPDTICTLAIGYNNKKYLSKAAREFIELSKIKLSPASEAEGEVERIL